jgi:lysophospholipid acyltransferase
MPLMQELSKDAKVVAFRAERALSELPSLLEYFSYMFFFGGLLVGPAFELREYRAFTDLSVFRQAGLHAVPSASCWGAVAKSLGLTALMFVGMEAQKLLPLPGVAHLPAFLADYSFAQRLAYLFVGITLTRFKYYFVWYLAEAGCISSGLGFNGLDPQGRPRWDRLNNIDIADVELCGSMSELTSGWNKRINHWLKYYVYQRVECPRLLTLLISPRSFANVCTKFTSAFWHGFYPGYYLFFLCAFFGNLADDEYHRLARPLAYHIERDPVSGKEVRALPRALPLVLAYRALAWLQVHFTLNYFAIGFILLDADKTMAAWSSVYYAGHVFVLAVIALGALLGPKKQRTPRAQPNAAATANAAAPAATVAATAATGATAAHNAAAAPSSGSEGLTAPARRTPKAD